MKPNKSKSYIEKAINFFVIACFLFIVSTFFLAKLTESANKPFWGDETYGLELSAGKHSYFEILINGAKGQASPAPLDYLALKFLDQIKERTSYFGLTPEVYFRLFANGITIFSALMILFLFRREIAKSKENLSTKAVQLLLLLCFPIAFLFTPKVYYFAAEARPYALWNSLFLLVLATSLLDAKNNKLLFALLILLSFSATAAIFQISAILLAYFIIGLLQKNDFRNILKKAIKLFAVPFFVVLYYCFRSGNWDMVRYGSTWDDFLKFWTHQSIIILIMLIAIAVCFVKRENRKYAIAPLSFLIVFLLGPLIFWITRFKGFFYVERQYIYYELSRPVFLLATIKCIPAYIKNAKSKTAITIILIVFFVVGGIFTLRPKRLRRFNKARINAMNVLRRDLQEKY